MDGKPMWQIVLRWLAFLPGAVAASIVVNVALSVINRLLMSLNGQNPDGIINKLWLDIVVNALVGAAFVYVGSKIAPSHRKPVSYALAFVAVLFAGASSFLAINQHNWWGLVGCVVTAAGAAYVAYAVATGDLDLDTHSFT